MKSKGVSLQQLAVPVRNAKQLRPGSLVGFRYGFAKHDVRPLVLVTGMTVSSKGGYLLEGVNLHYVAPPTAANLLTERAGDVRFVTDRASSDSRAAQAMRRYRVDGIDQAVAVDWRALLAKLEQLGKMDPSERAKLSRRIAALLSARTDVGLVISLAQSEIQALEKSRAAAAVLAEEEEDEE